MSATATTKQAVLSEGKEGWIYNRSRSNESEALSHALAKVHGVHATQCLIQPSGMAAIATTLHALIHLHHAIDIWYGSELYSDTPKLVSKMTEVYGKERVSCHVYDMKMMKEMWPKSSRVQIALVESATNPTNQLFDFAEWNGLKASCGPKAGTCLIVDNTWLTHVLCNPLQGNADVVITSLAKYYSGGHVIGGAILVNPTQSKLRQAIIDWTCLNGLHTSPLNCEIVVNQMSEMEARIKTMSESTVALLGELKKTFPTLGVTHPSLVNSSSQKKLYPGVFTVTVPHPNKSKTQLVKLLKPGKVLKFKTSYGGPDSRIDPWPLITSTNIRLRISIGYDSDWTLVWPELKALVLAISKSS